MQILKTVAAAFSMFSAIPMPQTPWDKRTMRFALCAFPLTGAAIALCWLAWGVLSDWLSLPSALRGAGWTALPVVLTGGVHLDGYADTADALASHASPERRREILKDPRCGAFAVIWLCLHFIAYFALCASLRSYAAICPAFVLSRGLSGAALVFLPLSDAPGLARTFVEASDIRRVRAVLVAECAAAAIAALAFGVAGIAMLCAAGIVFARYAVVARRDFGGVSGDLAGWFLQKAEFWMLAAAVLAQCAQEAF